MSALDWRDEALRLREEGLTVRAIAAAVGKARATVGELLRPHYCECGRVRARDSIRCDACRRERQRWCAERIEELVAGMYDDGWMLKEIAVVLGRTHATPREASSAIGPELHRARARGLISTTRVRTGWGTWAPA